MTARRFPRLSRLLVPLITLSAVNLSLAPPAEAAEVIERTLDLDLKGANQTLALPIPTNLVAASIEQGGADPEVQIKTSDGVWHPIEFEADHGPDATERAQIESSRRFSDPVWVGSLTRLKIKAEQPASIRLHLINSMGGVRRGPLAILGSIWHSLTVPRYEPAAVPDQPIITRKQWGANESWVNGPPGPADRLDAFFVHHTDSPNTYSRDAVPGMVRGIYRYHTKTQGWSDIGYNFLIDRFGRIYEGRAGSIAEPMIGAHARGANERSAGVSLIGNFTSTSVPRPMKIALARLIAWKADIHHVPLIGSVVLPGGKKFQRINGHRDANPTACPGNKAYGLLSWVRKSANAYGGAKIFEPRASGVILRPDGDGASEQWRLRAWANRSLVWTLEITDSQGTVVNRQTATGVELASQTGKGLNWTAQGPAGALVPSGTYRWKLTGVDAKGGEARPADGIIYVVTDHPSGTVLADELGTYLVEQDSIRTVSSLTLKTLYARRGAISTGSDERSRYSAPLFNTPVPPRQGALLKTSTNELLVVASATEVSPFSTSAVATALGYRAKNAILVTDKDLVGTTRGAPITAIDRHPAGTFVTDGTSTFRVRANDRIPASPFVIAAFGAQKEILTATQADLDLPVAQAQLEPPDGTIVFRDMPAPKRDTYWMLTGGTRRYIANRSLFSAFGAWIHGAVPGSYQDIRSYPTGAAFR